MMGFCVQLIDSFFCVELVATFRIKICYAELPIISPTNYIYEKYKNFGNEKWEIYVKVLKNLF